MEKSFIEIVQDCRRKNGWTVKEFIVKLGGNLSPAYITKIEVHGEIPRPGLICEIATVCNLNKQDLLEIAKKSKVQQFEESLEKKYRHALDLYKSQKVC